MHWCIRLILLGLVAGLTPLAWSQDLPTADLILRLKDVDASRVQEAARTLGLRGSAKEALPVLRELLAHRDESVQLAAAEALWRLEHKAGELVPVYAKLLKANDRGVRAAAAWRLGRLGQHARPVVANLVERLSDEDHTVRRHAEVALVNLGPVASAALPELVRLLDDKDEHKRIAAKAALSALDDEAIPRLIAYQGMHPERIASVFPSFGAAAVPPLVKALDAPEARTQTLALLALYEVARVNGLPESVVPRLEKELENANEAARLVAARTVILLRPASEKALAILLQAYQKGSLTANHLADASPHSPAAVPALLALLDDRNANVAESAVRALQRLRLPSAEMVPVWTRALAHPVPAVRSAALESLSGMGPRAKSAWDTLWAQRELEKERGASLLSVLVRIAPDEPRLLPVLRESLAASDQAVHELALAALLDLGPRAGDILPLLEKYLLRPRGPQEAISSESGRRILLERLQQVTPKSPKSPKVTTMLLAALRRADLRSLNFPNYWHQRDLLEDALFANLPAGVDLLIEALRDAEPEVRQSVALVLLRAGREVEAALPVLMADLWPQEYPAEEKQRFQARVVEVFKRRPSSATPAVVAAWCQAWKTTSARQTLTGGLLVLQREALPLLKEQLREARPSRHRLDLACLLAQFDDPPEEVVPVLCLHIRVEYSDEGIDALRACEVLGPKAAGAVPDLIRWLDRSQGGGSTIIRTLGRIGPAAKAALPALKARLRNQDAGMAHAAAIAISQIDLDVPEALDFLRTPQSVARPENADALTRYGKRAVPALVEILDNRDLDEWAPQNNHNSYQHGSPARIRAALTLAKLGPDAAAAVPALIRALDDFDSLVRNAAASALGRIGPAAKAAAPEFIAQLEKQNRFLSAEGAWSATAGRVHFGPFGYGYSRTTPERRLFDSGFGGYGYRYDHSQRLEPEFPFDAEHVLGRIDGEARSAEPILSEMAKNPDHPRRLAAALALWRAGSPSPHLKVAFEADIATLARRIDASVNPISPELHECLAEFDVRLKAPTQLLVEWVGRSYFQGSLDDQITLLDLVGRQGEDDHAEANALQSMLKAERWIPHRRAALAVAVFRVTGKSDVPFAALREILHGPESRAAGAFSPALRWTARADAARALLVLAESDERARALLADVAKGDENPHVRLVGLTLLARDRATRAGATRGLSVLLGHVDPVVREAAAEACGRLGALARPCVEGLKRATDDGSLAVRQAATQALKRVE